MANKNVILKDGSDYLFPKTKTSIVVNENDETLDAILTSKADLVDGRIPSSQLPSYVDDVIELVAVTDAVMPTFEYKDGDRYLNSMDKKIYTLTDGEWVATDEPKTGVIYVNTTNNSIYRWGGTMEVEISSTDITSKQDKIYSIGLLKGDGLGNISEAEAGVDYAEGEHTHDASEINGLSVSTEQLNYLEGVTGSIQEQLNEKAPTDSPALTGVPTAPTAASGTSTTQVATTEYVQREIGTLKHITYETI